MGRGRVDLEIPGKGPELGARGSYILERSLWGHIRECTIKLRR